MEAHGWRSGQPLNRLVRQNYAHFDFFQLVRLLLRERGADDARGLASGGDVRFRADLSAAFPGNEVTGLDDHGESAPFTVTTPNYGVAGYLGPLPEPFTEWVREQLRSGDRAMADFLDLFNHRINALRYQLKARNRLGLNNGNPEDTPHAGYLAALMGMDAPGLAEQLPLPRRAWLGIAGLLANNRRSAPVIVSVLSAYLGAKVDLRPLCGAWRDMDSSDRTHLGAARTRLGTEAVLGARVWDRQSRIELTIGPLEYSRYCQLLPGERAHDGFVALLRFLVDRQFDCQVRLLLDTGARPEPTLAARPGSAADRSMRLAQTAWLGRTGTADQSRGTCYLVRAFDLAEAA